VGIPADARAVFGGRRELLKSLDTKDPDQAKRQSLAVIADFQAQIDRARSGQVFWQSHHMPSYLGKFSGWSGWQLKQWNARWLYDSRDEFVADLARFIQAELSGLSQADQDEFRKYVEGKEADRLFPDVPKTAPQPTNQIRLSKLERKLLDDGNYAKRSVQDVQKAFAYLRELYGDVYARDITPAHIRECVSAPNRDP
jgi:hypothetical protein